jgi:uncharacterized protein DUF3107
MEVKIGVVYSPRELTIEVEGSSEELMDQIQSALKDSTAMLWLVDRKGKRVGVPVDKVAYVEIAEEDPTKRVGFGPD